MTDSRESLDKKFENDVKVLLSGYIESEDTRGYLALKIVKLHETYLEEVIANER